MPIHVTSERQVIQETAQVLIKRMSPAKAARFWASWQISEGDYLVIREQLFEKETAQVSVQKDRTISEEENQEKGGLPSKTVARGIEMTDENITLYEILTIGFDTLIRELGPAGDPLHSAIEKFTV